MIRIPPCQLPLPNWFRNWVFAAALVVSALVGGAMPVHAQATVWTIGAVDGIVVHLVAGEWREVAPGDSIVSLTALRTLKNSGIQLRWGDTVVNIGSEAALTVVSATRTAPTYIEQYAGVVQITAGKTTVMLRTEDLQVASALGGDFTVSVADGDTTLLVRAGAASVVSARTGKHLEVQSGKTVSGSGVVTATSGATAGAAVVEPSGNNGNAESNGNGNGGKKGNGGGGSGNNGNGNGSSGNNGKGNGNPKKP